MKLGSLEFFHLTDGRFMLDGGAFFGVIPRPLWEKKLSPDARNRVLLKMHSLLILSGGKKILVETGAGDKLDAKRREIFAIEDGPRLPDRLGALGVKPEEIDVVVNTHLHFDHCGWNTHIVNGRAVPMFPNARHVVQRGELEYAKHPSERDHVSFSPDNFAPIEAAGQWWLVEGDREIAPGVELVRVPGHTRDMMSVKLSGGGKTAFFAADLLPTAAHVPLAWMTGFDLYPLTTLESKKKWVPQAAREEWLVLFAHDAAMPAGYLRERDGWYAAEPAEIL